MYTDPLHLSVDDPGHLEDNCPFIYLDAFATDEHFARYSDTYANLQEMKNHYVRGGLGDGTVKKFLMNVLDETLAPIRERRAYWEQHIPEIYDILRQGCDIARAAAADTLADVRRAMRINYFEDTALIEEQAKRFANK